MGRKLATMTFDGKIYALADTEISDAPDEADRREENALFASESLYTSYNYPNSVIKAYMASYDIPEQGLFLLMLKAIGKTILGRRDESFENEVMKLYFRRYDIPKAWEV